MWSCEKLPLFLTRCLLKHPVSAAASWDCRVLCQTSTEKSSQWMVSANFPLIFSFSVVLSHLPLQCRATLFCLLWLVFQQGTSQMLLTKTFDQKPLRTAQKVCRFPVTLSHLFKYGSKLHLILKFKKKKPVRLVVNTSSNII